MKKLILVGADPVGISLKEAVCESLKREGYEIVDVGSKEGKEVDYYDVGNVVGYLVSTKQYEKALLFCGTGMGVNIVANKHPGVYCGLCESVMTAKLCRTINNCNVLAMGALTTAPWKAIQMVKVFLETPFAVDFELAESDFLKQAVEKIGQIEEELYHDCSSQ